MNTAASFALSFLLTLTTAGYPQDRQRPAHTESPEERSPTFAKERREPSRPALTTESAEFTIAKQVDEVNLILSVTDSKGMFVCYLTAEDFKLFDNYKSPTKLTYFQARTNLPLRVVLAIDVSSSVRSRLRFEQQAASAFLKHVLR